MPADPALPTAEELAALPHEELAARLADAYRLISELSARVERLERQAAKDSGTSSKPPSSDSPYKKKPPRDRSLRKKGERAPGKQPGEPGSTMNLVDNPKYRYWYPPAECAGCGTGLKGEDVWASRRHQVTDIKPAPEPEVTEHVAQSKKCPCCGDVTEGTLPPGVRARASFGPEVHAQAANLTSGNFVPSGRAAALMADLAGVRVSLGWIASVRAKAAALVESSGFMGLVASLLCQAEAVHADETPARAAGGLRYVHLACTKYLTHMHTGDRSAAAVNAGGVLPGYQGILVRDGYHQGYGHLTDAVHAWCGAHLLRDLKDLYEFEDKPQEWAAQMAALLIEARRRPRRPRRGEEGPRPGRPQLRHEPLPGHRPGRAGPQHLPAHRGEDDACRIARRLPEARGHELRFVTRPDLDIFTNNEGEKTIRPVKVQQRASGGCWACRDSPTSPSSSPTCHRSEVGRPKIDASAASSKGTPGCRPA